MKQIIFVTIMMMWCLVACEPPKERIELAQERQRRIEAERLVQHSEKVAKANAALAQEKEESRTRWQTFAFIMATGAVILLVFGAALGSKARDDAG